MEEGGENKGEDSAAVLLCWRCAGAVLALCWRRSGGAWVVVRWRDGGAMVAPWWCWGGKEAMALNGRCFYARGVVKTITAW